MFIPLKMVLISIDPTHIIYEVIGRIIKVGHETAPSIAAWRLHRGPVLHWFRTVSRSLQPIQRINPLPEQESAANNLAQQQPSRRGSANR